MRINFSFPASVAVINVNKLYRLIYLGFGLMILGLSATHLALADCNNAIPKTTPDQSFTIHDDGTVTHTTTGLMWMRCLIGQTWNGSTCSGKAQSYTWRNALQTAETFSFAGHNDWRLPNKNELTSIVERACYKPAINTTAFPNTSISYDHWSSSSYTDNFEYAWFAWVVSFENGYVRLSVKNGFFDHVRLVRGGQ